MATADTETALQVQGAKWARGLARQIRRPPQTNRPCSRNLEQVLDETDAAASSQGVAATTVIRDGNPADEIVSYADGQDIDLIIMATHGRKGVDRFLHGSITETVLRTAEQPVLAV